jgi:c-di-GMP-binding flagellar brake protein YcgR
MTFSIDDRRLQPRHEPAAPLFVDIALRDGTRTRAQVLDWSRSGMRLLFRPAVDLERGGAIAVSDADGDQREPALVQWCHHKRRFTVAGIRASGASFELHLANPA